MLEQKENFEDYDEYIYEIAFNDFSTESLLQSYPYDILQKLLEWHFDIFALIKNNLAIDINILEKKSEMQFNKCEHCGACDGRAGILFQKSKFEQKLEDLRNEKQDQKKRQKTMEK